MGDGGSAGDPENRGQNPAELLGKLLRLTSKRASRPTPSRPPIRSRRPPATGAKSGRWGCGTRGGLPSTGRTATSTSPTWVRMSTKRWIYQPAASRGGENYGWRVMEGTHCYKTSGCDPAGLTLPVAEYDHSQGCSVTGGVIYRGDQFDRLVGTYLYGDYCSGRIWGLRKPGAGWTQPASARHRIQHQPPSARMKRARST